MYFDTAQISLVGDRRDNEDRSEILVTDNSVMAVVADGMGGHAHGDLAAEAALASLASNFRRSRRSLGDAEGFLNAAFAAAHQEVHALGKGLPPDNKPGTTAVCVLVKDARLWWTGVGDSRAYHVRGGQLLERTVDHTMIESLLAAGQITREQALLHPDRHIVEYCLGVERQPPPIEVQGPREVVPGDVVLLCSDGLWGQLGEPLILERLGGDDELETIVRGLAEDAVAAAHPHSDNVTVAVLRAIADDGTAP